jgi:hypothetical protein
MTTGYKTQKTLTLFSNNTQKLGKMPDFRYQGPINPAPAGHCSDRTVRPDWGMAGTQESSKHEGGVS